jgi:hypothetical protein
VMRKLLYDVAKISDYNLSSSYGLRNNCEIPNSCVEGERLFITYGHALDGEKLNGRRIGVSMLREPMDWLISRYKFELKMNRNNLAPASLVEAAIEFGPRYFAFFDAPTRVALNGAFSRLVRTQHGEDAQLRLSPDVKRDIDDIVIKTKSLWESSVIILIYSEYDASIYLMAELLGNPVFKSIYDKKYKGIRINSAADTPVLRAIGLNQSSLDYLGAKSLLQLHYVLYQLAVSEFHRELRMINDKLLVVASY